MNIRPATAALGSDKLVGKAAVIGAGAMGAGIAAQFANAGVPVILLDLPGKDGDARNAVAAGGIARQLKVGGFMHPASAALVEAGNTDDDLGRLSEVDWVVEAIIEDLAIKQALYARLAKVLKPQTLLSSNTSTIRLADLTAAMEPRLRRNFLIVHFFNPPRAMRLVEIVSGRDTDPSAVERATAIADIVLGKTPVTALDTPGFIANRIGCHWLAMAASEAIAAGLTVEDADAVAGTPFGVPRTGIFGLFDLVGIDLVPTVWGTLRRTLAADDDLQNCDIEREPAFRALLERRLFGRKAGGGFYRLTADRKREAFDFGTLDYRPERPAAAVTGDLAALCAEETPNGRYAWRVLSRMLCYAAEHAFSIAAGLPAIDTAMRLGYNWKWGPFALADRVGVAGIAERLAREGRAIPEALARAVKLGGFYAGDGGVLAADGKRSAAAAPAGSLSLAAAKASAPPVLQTPGAALIDIGEGVACLELRTKFNILDDDVFEAMERTVEALPRGFRALVIGNEHERSFSAGANLAAIAGFAEKGDWSGLERFLHRGQDAMQALKYAPFPVVGAAFGLALGGGCEILLHCDAVVAHAELNAGLPETKVGLVPGWGGCTQLLTRFAAKPGVPHGPLAAAAAAFAVIFPGRVSTSALEAFDMAVLRNSDAVTMNRDRVLADARSRAVDLASGYTPPARPEIVVTGPSGRLSLMGGVEAERRAGRATDTDMAIGEALAGVLSGGADADPVRPASEADIMRLEREALTALTKRPAVLERIRHMLATGKPLRN